MNCGSHEDLHVVTCNDSDLLGPGRILVHCRHCRISNRSRTAVSFPLSMLTEQIFVELYRTGQTRSDPEISVPMVMGEDNPKLVHEIQSFLESNKRVITR